MAFNSKFFYDIGDLDLNSKFFYDRGDFDSDSKFVYNRDNFDSNSKFLFKIAIFNFDLKLLEEGVNLKLNSIFSKSYGYLNIKFIFSRIDPCKVRITFSLYTICRLVKLGISKLCPVRCSRFANRGF
jgi:hypothetical protein